MRSGKGIYTTKSGIRYEGEWQNNLRHGVGLLIFEDGSYYNGDWFNS